MCHYQLINIEGQLNLNEIAAPFVNQEVRRGRSILLRLAINRNLDVGRQLMGIR